MQTSSLHSDDCYHNSASSKARSPVNKHSWCDSAYGSHPGFIAWAICTNNIVWVRRCIESRTRATITGLILSGATVHRGSHPGCIARAICTNNIVRVRRCIGGRTRVPITGLILPESYRCTKSAVSLSKGFLPPAV